MATNVEERPTMLNISELRRLEEDATAGEWSWWMSDKPPFEFCRILPDENVIDIGIKTENINNAQFVAASRNHFRQLLDIVEAAKRRGEIEFIINNIHKETSNRAPEWCVLLDKHGECVSAVRELLEDVEVGDA